jgi:hypothetical protein
MDRVLLNALEVPPRLDISDAQLLTAREPDDTDGAHTVIGDAA